jgi:hypothetical protein
MGQPDLYPFVLAPAVIAKLAFIHERVHAWSGRRQGEVESHHVLKAVIGGLNSRIGAPQSA